MCSTCWLLSVISIFMVDIFAVDVGIVLFVCEENHFFLMHPPILTKLSILHIFRQKEPARQTTSVKLAEC